MKKYIFLIPFMLMTAFADAQTNPSYCEFSVYQPNFKRYVAAINHMGSHKRKFEKIKNSNGKPMKFECRLDALNYMTRQGWEVVTACVIPHSGGETRYYMKKQA